MVSSVLIAAADGFVNGSYPGGASATDPAPEAIAFYASPLGYAIVAMTISLLLVWAVTRLNVDR
jgi:hypothetical protein